MPYTNKKSVIKNIKQYQKLANDDFEYIEDIEPRINEYISEVLYNYESHNKYEILAVFRFLDFIDKYSFDRSRFRKFVMTYEFLKFPSDNGPQSFALTPIQVFQFASMYGFVKDNGTMLCNDALLYVPRKFSKTTSVAACAIYDLMFGSADAQAYVASNSFNQANICFSIISNTLKPLDPQMKSFRRNRDKIYSKLPGRTSFIQCLSSAPDRLDGLNASTIILDEYAAAPSAALKNVLTSSQGVRKNPLIITITTASTVLAGPFSSVDLPNYKKILECTIEDDSVFASIFEPDEGDDYACENTWKKVQPHLGITVNIDFYRRAWLKAQRSADDMTEFRTKLLNIFTANVQAIWIKQSVLRKNVIDIDFAKITTRPVCFVSIDLSVKDDLSAVTYLMYDSIQKIFWEKTLFYCPKTTIETHTSTELYRRWKDEGYLIECGEDVIDYEMIAKDVISNAKYLNIVNISYDSYKNRDCTNYLRAQGIKCLTSYRQTYSYFTGPVEATESMIYKDQIKFDDNPIMFWMFSNVVIDTDTMDNKKPIKVSQNKKIDGVITLLMSIGTAINYKR